MKARVYLSVGALLLFLAPLGCSDKAESPAPETPPEEQPTPEPEPEKPEFVDANMSMEELMKTEDPDRNYRLVSYRDDTCAMYSFFDPMTELQRGTPRDQLQWVSEKVDGNSVRWTYRITNGDHDEAVRQTLERWAEKEDEEEYPDYDQGKGCFPLNVVARQIESDGRLFAACGYVYNSALSLRSLLGGGLGVHSVPSGHEVCNHDQEK